MSKKFLLFLLFFAVVGSWFAYSKFQQAKLQEERELELLRKEQAILAEVANLKKNYNADSNWMRQLTNGSSVRLDPIMTIELERVWLKEKPIIFFGSILDVSTDDSDNYRLEIERGFYGSFGAVLDTDLRLSLLYPRDKFDSFVGRYPEVIRADRVLSGIVVVADIESISSQEIPDADSEYIDIKVGKGKMLDIIYSGSVIPKQF